MKPYMLFCLNKTNLIADYSIYLLTLFINSEKK